MATKMKTLTINDVTYDITDDSAVSFVEEQNLTEAQKAQARANIGVTDNLAAISSISIEYGRYEGASYYIARIPKYTVDGKRC